MVPQVGRNSICCLLALQLLGFASFAPAFYPMNFLVNISYFHFSPSTKLCNETGHDMPCRSWLVMQRDDLSLFYTFRQHFHSFLGLKIQLFRAYLFDSRFTTTSPFLSILAIPLTSSSPWKNLHDSYAFHLLSFAIRYTTHAITNHCKTISSLCSSFISFDSL